jgi:hypothetical protein
MTFDQEQERRRIRNIFASDQATVELELGKRRDTGQPFRVPVSAFDRHAQFVGTTGGGKTYGFRHLFQELALHTDSTQVFLDVTGNAYDRLKRWAYSEGLDDRLVLIDPTETRLICGVNPVAPWPDNHRIQAVLAWEALSLALDTGGIAQSPLIGEWMCNVLYGLINTGLTMYEAPNLIEYNDDSFRRAVIQQLEEELVRKEFLRLQDIVYQKHRAHADWQQEVGGAHRRIQRYVSNPRLRLMLGTAQHAVDWDQVLDERKLVLVNLSGVRDRTIVLARDDARMLGLQIINELIEVCWRRSEAAGDKAPPCYAFVDECQHFISPNLERILSEGRQFNLRLLLAHRVGKELQNEEHARFISLVSSCTQAKAVFGGLDWTETEELARNIWAHHLNLLQVKDEIRMPVQISDVVEVEDRTTTVGGSSAQGRGSNSGTNEQFAADAARTGSATSAGFSDSQVSGENWAEAIHRHLQVLPRPPEERVVSRQFWTRDELLHLATARIVQLPTQAAVFAAGKQAEPVEFEFTFLDEPSVSSEDALGIDLERMRVLPHYGSPELIEEEIQDRQAEFLRLLQAPQKDVTPYTLGQHREPEKKPRRR